MTPIRPALAADAVVPSLWGGRYLVRFDDVCPTMNWAVWDQVEALLVEAGAAPILAVVPDNQDPNLRVAPPLPEFWERVRGWQARGWAIGLHGWQHTYVNRESGLLRLNRASEFAGLDLQEQVDKLRRGLEVFAREGVKADCWVAPSHSFDWTTVAALAEVGLDVISDGMALAPYRDPTGCLWIPQQFANMRPMPYGAWTFCYHLNGFSAADLGAFVLGLHRLRPRMITLAQAMALGERPRSSADRLVGLARRGISGLRRLAG